MPRAAYPSRLTVKSRLPVLREHTSNTRSGGLPTSLITYPLRRMTRSGGHISLR